MLAAFARPAFDPNQTINLGSPVFAEHKYDWYRWMLEEAYRLAFAAGPLVFEGSFLGAGSIPSAPQIRPPLLLDFARYSPNTACPPAGIAGDFALRMPCMRACTAACTFSWVWM